MTKSEIKFLEGPQNRFKDFKFAVTVLFEFIKGFRTLHFAGPCVTVFGSARFKEDHIYYKQAQALAGEIAKLGFTIMTGGGPGIMEAANRGAKDVGGRSVGCNIILPHEQFHNAYLDKWVNIKYFLYEKLTDKILIRICRDARGFGTLDEYFEALTLIQTGMLRQFPIIIFDKAFHKDIIDHIEMMKLKATISSEDINLCLFTDSIEEAVTYIQQNAITKFGLKSATRKRPLRWLFERQ